MASKESFIFIFLSKFVMFLVHQIAFIIETLRWIHIRLHSLVVWSYDYTVAFGKYTQFEHSILEQCKSRLTKIPHHICIIIGFKNKHFNEKYLTRLFTYALKMDIDCISIFDARLGGDGNISLETLCTTDGYRCRKLARNGYIWTNTADEVPNGASSVNKNSHIFQQNGFAQIHTNGAKTKPKSVKIFKIIAENNHELLISVIRDLFTLRHSPELQKSDSRTFIAKYIQNALSNHLDNLEEPDLCIVFNDDTCTFGAIPWHLGFAEFQTVETCQYFTAKTFANMLYEYGKCEQRWGI